MNATLNKSSGAPGKTVAKSIGLLIIQPTPFCNIDCDYCYLADRLNTRRMVPCRVIEAIDRVVASGFVNKRMTVVWHAGEPLTVPVSYYEEVFSVLSDRPYATLLQHSIQTNGMLINRSWCDLFRRRNVRIGVSLDGPAFVHDAHRKDRAGRGTHARVIAGIRCLQEYGIPFHVISVITADSLDHPREIFEFFIENRIQQVGFNIEELEGCHDATTLSKSTAVSRLESFFDEMSLLQAKSGHKIRIREFDHALRTILSKDRRWDGSEVPLNDQSLPMSIVSIDSEGGMSTFSPELLGAKSKEFGNFVFGNIFSDNISDVLRNKKFLAVAQEIEEGVRLCSRTCDYFPLCGGGAPSNKYFENGSFKSSETLYCQGVIQIPIRIMLRRLEENMNIPTPPLAMSRQVFSDPPFS